MSRAVIARRYAQAFLAAADARQADVASLLEAIRSWGTWLESEHEAAVALRSPVVDPERKARLLAALIDADGTDALVGNLLRLCLSKNRLAILTEVARELQAQLDLRAGVVRGEGVSAHPLPQTLQDRVVKHLRDALAADPLITWTEDPSLIGGFQVRVGGRLWDASLRTQLERLGETIRKGVR